MYEIRCMFEKKCEKNRRFIQTKGKRFVEYLNDLFDVAHKNELKMAIKEYIEFLELQRLSRLYDGYILKVI